MVEGSDGVRIIDLSGLVCIMASMPVEKTVKELAQHVGGKVKGDEDIVITGA